MIAIRKEKQVLRTTIQMETINKLLKKQAPKNNRRGANADKTADGEANKPDPTITRWVSNKDGSRIGVPEELLAGPLGKVYLPNGSRSGLPSGKMVEEVA
jgi:Ino eighty subunit 2